jgi:hypothetical protein
LKESRTSDTKGTSLISIEAPGTPMLGDVPCACCNGTGRVKLSSSDAARWLLDEVGRMEREIAVAIMHKIKE